MFVEHYPEIIIGEMPGMYELLSSLKQQGFKLYGLTNWCSKVAQQAEVEQQWSSKDRVAAEEVDLDLHRITHPSEDVDVVPSLLVVVARWIIVDANLMIILGVLIVAVAVEVWLLFWLQDCLQGRELAHLLGVEVGWLIENETVAVAQNVGREPSVQAQAAGADDFIIFPIISSPHNILHNI